MAMSDSQSTRRLARSRASNAELPAPKRARTAMTPCQTSSYNATQLDPDGDVILILQPENGDPDDRGKPHLVSSKLLSMASSVFKAMFGPSFREGAHIREGNVPDLTLKEDHVDAMAFILRVIHTQALDGVTDDVPQDVCLGAIAVQIDKYDCIRSIHASVTRWLQTEAAKTHPSLEEMMHLACLLASQYKVPGAVVAQFINLAKPSQWLRWRKLDCVIPPDVVEKASESAGKVNLKMLNHIFECATEIYTADSNSPSRFLCEVCKAYFFVPAGKTNSKCPACEHRTSICEPASCNAEKRSKDFEAILKALKLFPVSKVVSCSSPSLIAAGFKRCHIFRPHPYCDRHGSVSGCPLNSGLRTLERGLQRILAESDSFDIFTKDKSTRTTR